MTSGLSVSFDCPNCQKSGQTTFRNDEPIRCPFCNSEWGRPTQKETIFDSCPTCASRHFYKHRDFNQALGCFIMLVGIVLVPKTFGLSLPVLAFFDWLLYRKTRDVVTCYRCLMEFRGFETPSHIQNFEHHLGEKYQDRNNS